MAEITATGMDALELLNKQKETVEEKPEQLPAIPVKPLPVELPSGWKLRDLKHGHLLAFYDAEPFAPKYKSRFHEAQAHIEAAINAKFFELPTAVTADILADMEPADVEQLQQAVVNCVLNKVRTPKN